MICSCKLKYIMLLYSWRFSGYSAPLHWLVHGHMTSDNETVSRQTPWAGNIAKTMTSTGKQLCYPRNVDRCCTWSEREGGLMLSQESHRVFQNLLLSCFVLLYNKSLNDWSLGKQWILFPSNLNVLSKSHWDSRETKFTVPLGTSH